MQTERMKRVLVIGAGVCGLTSAVQIAEFYKGEVQVTLISDKFSPDTTGDGSAGLWSPYLCNQDDQVISWSEQTHRFFKELWQKGLANEVGLCLIPMVRLTSATEYKDREWIRIPFGGHSLTEDQLKVVSRNLNKTYRAGIHFVSFTCEVAKLLPYLLQRFKNAGGSVVQGKVNDMMDKECEGYDIIVNCTGLGAKEMVSGETDLHPIRGQVNRVSAPWMYQVILDDDDDGRYIIPNPESVILGGTHQYNDYNRNVSNVDDQFIMNGCRKMVPAIGNAPILKQWVGLRPGRSSIRLEIEHLPNGRHVIHNYGHGGSGVTLSWGCGISVLELFHKLIKETSIKSKM